MSNEATYSYTPEEEGDPEFGDHHPDCTCYRCCNEWGCPKCPHEETDQDLSSFLDLEGFCDCCGVYQCAQCEVYEDSFTDEHGASEDFSWCNWHGRKVD